jgi:hypothetical protein
MVTQPTAADSPTGALRLVAVLMVLLGGYSAFGTLVSPMNSALMAPIVWLAGGLAALGTAVAGIRLLQGHTGDAILGILTISAWLGVTLIQAAILGASRFATPITVGQTAILVVGLLVLVRRRTPDVRTSDRPAWATALYVVAWTIFLAGSYLGLYVITVAITLLMAEPTPPGEEASWAWLFVFSGVPVALAGIIGGWMAVRALGTYRPGGPEPSRVGLICGRCGKPLSPYWPDRCRHCDAAFSEFPPVRPG